MKKFFLILCLTSYIFCIYSQNEDYNWIIGNGTLNQVSFSSSSYSIDTFTPNPSIEIYKTNSTISDSLGNLLLFTGGAAIYDLQGNILENGDSINYGYIWETWSVSPGAYSTINGTLFFSSLNRKSEYFLFHLSGDTFQNINNNFGLGSDIMYSTINTSDINNYIVEKKI